MFARNKPDVFKDRLQQLQAQKLNESPSQNKVEGNSVDNVINVEDAIVRKLNLNSTDAHAVPEKKISDDEQSDHQDKSIRVKFNFCFLIYHYTAASTFAIIIRSCFFLWYLILLQIKFLLVLN